jgi:copper resistance protein C
MRLYRLTIPAALLCAALAGRSPALAHAIVVESQPAVDAVVTGPDVSLRLRFNSRIDQERSRLTLTGGGKTWALAMTVANTPDRLESKAAGLPPGAYTLRWQVLAVDGHITRGDIPFRVTP